MNLPRRGNQIESFAVVGTNGIMQRVFSFMGEANQYVILHNSGMEEFSPFKVVRLAVPRINRPRSERDHQQFEAGRTVGWRARGEADVKAVYGCQPLKTEGNPFTPTGEELFLLAERIATDIRQLKLPEVQLVKSSEGKRG